MSQSVALDLDEQSPSTRHPSVPFLALTTSHALIDCLATLLPASLALIEVRCGMTHAQAAWLLGLGSFTSGVAQPVSALISDRLLTRGFIAGGIVLTGVGFGLLGLTETALSLAVFYILGMLGAGAFHPIAATSSAQLDLTRRNSATGLFFVAGMFGGVFGAILWPRWLATSAGFSLLPVIILPIVAFAFWVHLGIARLPKMKSRHLAVTDLGEIRGNWGNVMILYVSSSMRYCVNTALVYLFVRWSQQLAQAENRTLSENALAKLAAPLSGNLNAAMIFGMACGGFLAGALVKPDREKKPLIWVPILFAPVVALFPRFGIEASYLMAVLAGVGFSSMIPISVALAQHLLPHRANFAASLMMGGAWMVATIGPRSAEFGVAHFGLNQTFLATALLLATSGLVCTFLKPPVPAIGR